MLETSQKGKELLASTPKTIGDRDTYEELSRHSLCLEGHDTNHEGRCFTCSPQNSYVEYQADSDDYDGLCYATDNSGSEISPKKTTRIWSCGLCAKLGIHLKYFPSEIKAHVEQMYVFSLIIVLSIV